MVRSLLYELTWFGAAVGGAACVTALVRRRALAVGILDIPNARSSHTHPTPRGGGLSIVLASLAGVVVLACIGFLSVSTAIALAGGGIAIAAVGYIDDKRGLPPLVRLIVHVAAATF